MTFCCPDCAEMRRQLSQSNIENGQMWESVKAAWDEVDVLRRQLADLPVGESANQGRGEAV